MNKHFSFEEASAWQSQRSAESAHWEDLRRIGAIVIPVVLLIFIMVMAGVFYSFIHSLTWFAEILTRLDGYLVLAKMNLAYLGPLFLLILVIILLFRATAHFIRVFYQPSEDIRLSPRLSQRLLGVPPLPTPLKLFWKYPFVTIKEPEDLSSGHWTRWLGGTATLVVYDGNALYLESGNRFSRVVGPGKPPMPFLDRFETVKAVVDLRPQIKTWAVHPWTKDGIQLDMTITMECQINASEEARLASRNLVYPFDPIAVKQAVEFTAVRSRPGLRTKPPTKDDPGNPADQQTPPSNIQDRMDLVESEWLDGVWGKTTGYINRHISCHSIDEIALSELNEVGPSEGNLYTFRLAQEHIDKINQELTHALCGAHVANIQITMSFPVEVKEHRIRYWESDWQKRSSIRKSKSEGARIRLVEEARARAEKDMLDAIIGQLKTIDKDNLTEPLLMSLTGILDNSLDDPLIRPIIARNSLSLLEQLRGILKGGFFDEDQRDDKKDQDKRNP